MNERKQTITAAVDEAIRQHDLWADDPEAPEVPSERLELAIDGAISTCAVGDIPGDCRQLVGAIGKLAEEWAAYKNGQWDREHRPLGSFWVAFREMVTARRGANARPPRKMEPVGELLKQKVSYSQIANHIYGYRGKGPFLDDSGLPRIDLILKEGADPGSVIPADWVHPEEAERHAAETAALNGRIASLQSHAVDVSTIDKASIESLLREGAFPGQIARAKGVTVDEVYAVARQLDIKPNEMPNITTLRAPGEPQITPEQDAALQPKMAGPLDDDDDDDEDDGPEIPAGMDDEAINSLILETATAFPDLGAGELAAHMTNELAVAVSAQKVAGVLRSRKKQLQQA